jgi:hypothetical protein
LKRPRLEEEEKAQEEEAGEEEQKEEGAFPPAPSDATLADRDQDGFFPSSVAFTAVAWNPNVMAPTWLAYGAASGLVRLQVLRWLLQEPGDAPQEQPLLDDADPFFLDATWLTVRLVSSLLLFLSFLSPSHLPFRPLMLQGAASIPSWARRRRADPLAPQRPPLRLQRMMRRRKRRRLRRGTRLRARDG